MTRRRSFDIGRMDTMVMMDAATMRGTKRTTIALGITVIQQQPWV